MRLTAYIATLTIGLTIFSASGCAEKPPVTPQETTITLSVDMPREQTMQFLKQSALTLKLGTVQNDKADTVIAGASKAVITGPDAGPVNVIMSGGERSVKPWSTMITDKLPAKKL
jgi:hypothetical protein